MPCSLTLARWANLTYGPDTMMQWITLPLTFYSWVLPLTLLMLGVRTNHHDSPSTTNHSTLIAHFANRRTDFHVQLALHYRIAILANPRQLVKLFNPIKNPPRRRGIEQGLRALRLPDSKQLPPASILAPLEFSISQAGAGWDRNYSDPRSHSGPSASS